MCACAPPDLPDRPGGMGAHQRFRFRFDRSRKDRNRVAIIAIAQRDAALRNNPRRLVRLIALLAEAAAKAVGIERHQLCARSGAQITR